MTHYEHFVRQRITELRLAADISEHRLSLYLGKSGSYIRGITNGSAMPSFREFFNLCDYFNISPVDFLPPLQTSSPSITKSAPGCGTLMKQISIK